MRKYPMPFPTLKPTIVLPVFIRSCALAFEKRRSFRLWLMLFPPMHVHNREDEMFCVLEGEVIFQIEDKKYHAKKGDTVFAPRQLSYRFMIQSEEARMLVTLTPGKFADFFLEQSIPTIGEPRTIAPQGPPPPEAIQYMIEHLRAEYDVHFIAG
ncbi:cupin domain-containing protein [Mucilaginibacter ginkgonis]|uniref:Cupin domain-containing protein n=1 Tax=Mucilaginibacter ginkgonis TaxID=2682091 RepID=A0A6I4I2C5_9SPHI|nr:cupin domain-containing protein [Mucilaginibacter ginkgonis]QQL49200.1 cupin domain-containing protein [Mucilaginibacter ginkgonis]